MSGSAIESTISSLKSIVTIIAGLAITNSIVRLLVANNAASLDNVSIEALVLFLLFTLNVIRFHHGNVRHLDTTYSATPGKAVVSQKPVQSAGRTALDFSVIYSESVLFALLSFLIGKPTEFYPVFTVLLGIDVLWYLCVHTMVTDRRVFVHQKKWALNNVLTLFALVITFIISGRMGPIMYFCVGITCVIANTIVDFAISWQFYFPRAKALQRESK